MIRNRLQYLIIFSLLLLNNYILAGNVDFIEEGSKYENEEYLELFKIQNDLMSFTTNAGEIN